MKTKKVKPAPAFSDAEVDAMYTVESLLADLPEAVRKRVLSWLSERFGVYNY